MAKVKKNCDSRTRQSGLFPKLRFTNGAIALAVMGLILPTYGFGESKVSAAEPKNLIAQANNPQMQPRQQTSPNQQDQYTIQEQRRDNVTYEEVTNKLNALVGKKITVRGGIAGRLGADAFLITDEPLFGSERVVVVNASGNPLRLPSDDVQVQVTGVVRKASLQQLAQQYKLNLAGLAPAQYQDRPVIIAQSLAPAPQPSQVITNPRPYYGRAIAVPAEIQNVYNPTVFTLGGDLLAVVVNPSKVYKPQAVTSGEKVVATGMVRPLVIADLEREYGLKFEPALRTRLEREYAKKPILVTTAVYPSAVPEVARRPEVPSTPAVPPREVTAAPAPVPAPERNATVDADDKKTPQERSNVTAAEVADKAQALVGQTVTVRGPFVDKIGRSAFTIVDERLLGAEPILVVNVSGDRVNLVDDDIKVQVTGEVRTFSLAEIAKKYNMNFDRATYALYEGAPAVIARSIAPAPEPDEVMENPRAYYGKRIAVPGEVGRIYSPYAFVMDDNLLVLNPKAKPNFRQRVNEGEAIVVTGVLRQFNFAELEKEYGLDLEPGIERQLEADYAGRPVIVGEVSIYPSAVKD